MTPRELGEHLIAIGSAMRLGTSKIEWGSPAYMVLAGMAQEIMNIPAERRTVALANIRQDKTDLDKVGWMIHPRISVRLEVRFCADDFDPTKVEQPPTLAQGSAAYRHIHNTNGQPTT